MNEAKREDVALFRYGMILPFLSPEQLEWGVKGELRRRLAQEHVNIPHSKKHRVGEDTIRKWLAAYKAKGFDGLKPQGRSDQGHARKIPAEVFEKAVALKKEAPQRGVAKIIRIMETAGLIKPGEIKRSTLSRLFKEHGFDRKTLMKSHKIHRAFEALHPNQIWQSDILYGPYLPDPKAPAKNKRTYLAAFIDDFSRLVPHAEFYWDEKFPALENTLKKALLKRGLPQMIYVDNGKIFSARRLDAVCAALGIRKIHCPPYSPEGKGKIERFFRTVREDFLAEPEMQKVQTLHELNKLFWGWLEVAYHQRLHSSTNATPLERWQQHLGHYLRMVEEKELIELFLWQVNRKVSNVGLVSVDGLDFEVDGLLKQRHVEVRYNPFDLSWVHIYYQGRFFQKAYPFKLGRWSTAKSQPPEPPKPTPTGIKPLQQLAQKHREQKQKQAQKLMGIPPSGFSPPPEQPFTIAMFIHMVATALDTAPEAMHARVIERLQDFWKTHQPLRVETVGLAMAKAILTHGNNQHIDVYLNAIKALQLKWQNSSSASANPTGAAHHPNPGE
jgi:transposase InsO family protein